MKGDKAVSEIISLMDKHDIKEVQIFRGSALVTFGANSERGEKIVTYSLTGRVVKVEDNSEIDY